MREGILLPSLLRQYSCIIMDTVCFSRSILLLIFKCYLENVENVL